MDKVKASIIIPVYNDLIILEHFVNLILKAIKIDEYQLIFIIDGYAEEKILSLLNNLSESHLYVTYIQTEKATSYAHVNNVARKYAVSELLIFMNTDIFLESTCLDNMICALKHNNVQAVQPLLVYPQTNTVQSTGHVFGDGYNHHALKGQSINSALVNTSSARQALSLALCLIPASIFDEIGGFDEYYYNGWEGLDLTLKITEKGYRCWYEASAIAYHIEGGSRKRFRLNESQQAAHFWTIWGKKIKYDIIELFNMQLQEIDTDKEYLVIDYTTNRSWLSTLCNLSINYNEIINKVNYSDDDEIDLFKSLSYSALIYPGSVLFLVSSINQLSNNALWIKYRENNDDICFDLAGNIMKLKDNIGSRAFDGKSQSNHRTPRYTLP